MMRILRHDLRHRLLCGRHGDDAAVIEHKTIPILQPGRFLKVEKKGHVPLPTHGDAATVATVMRQHDAIGGISGIPVAGRKDRTGTDHGQSPRSMSPQRWCLLAAAPWPGL